MSSLNIQLKSIFDIFKNLINPNEKDNIDKNKSIITKNLFDLRDFLEKLEKSNQTQFEYDDKDGIKDFKGNFDDFLTSTPNENPKNSYYKFYKFIHKISDIFKSLKKFFDFEKGSINQFKIVLDDFFSELTTSFNKKFEEKYEKKFSWFDYKTTKEIKVLKTLINKDKDEFKNDFDKSFFQVQNNIDIEVKNFIGKLKEALKGESKEELIDDFKSYTKEYFLNYLNFYFNKYLDDINSLISQKLDENLIIKILIEAFEKTIQIKETKKRFDEDLEAKYKDAKTELNKEDLSKPQINALLNKFSKLFDTNIGDWKYDSTKDKSIRELKKKYDELQIEVQAEKVEVSEEFPDLMKITDVIKSAKTKLDKMEKISDSEEKYIRNFETTIDELKQSPQYASNEDYKRQIETVEKLYEGISFGEEKKTLKERVEKEVEEKRIKKEKVPKEERDENVIYFSDYINIFQILLKLFTYGAILFTFIVLFISIICVMILIYDIIMFIIKLFVNPKNFVRRDALDYSAKSIIKCSKNNYKEDRYLILTEQKQNLTIFNFGAYTIYLVVIYLVFYITLLLYSRILRYKFVGSIYDLDEHLIYILMIGLLLVYSFIHLSIFKFLFKPYVYVPYFNVDKDEKEVDDLINDYISINDEKTGDRLSNDDFFELLFDATKIDKLNDDLLNDIKTKDASRCLQQKIIIYDLYQYLRQYINFDDEFKKIFKNFCISKYDETTFRKIKKDDKEYYITFLSMLNYNEVKIISNFHEDLNLVNLLKDEDIEYYNKLNTDISKNINIINKRIIKHNKTTLPFFLNIFYLILILILNFVVIFIVIRIIISDKTDSYNYYIVLASTYVYKYLYEPILNLFYSQK